MKNRHMKNEPAKEKKAGTPKQKRPRDLSRGRRTGVTRAGAAKPHVKDKALPPKSQTRPGGVERVITYIDGFNLYYGLKSAGMRRFYWLNLQTMAKNLLKTNQKLAQSKYFTSRVSSPPEKQERQATYIEALETLDDFQIYFGHYQSNLQECRKCGNKVMVPSEKMTDVNIAMEMLTDAYQDLFDVALLISADSDLTAPVLAIKKLFPRKRVVVAFPPHRHSAQLQRLAHAHMQIGRANLARSVFPDRVQKSDGYILTPPLEWR